jgi:molybdopterin synthase catalytic subunit
MNHPQQPPLGHPVPAVPAAPDHPAAPLSLSLNPDRFEAWAELQRWEEGLAASTAADPAATAVFIGRVRGRTAAGLPLEALELEHYPGMAEAQLRQLASACARRHRATAVLVRHRVGLIPCGEAIVLVAVAADRRGPAQRCCQELLEALKHHAPFWKREWSRGQGAWVLGNTPLAEAVGEVAG